MSNRVFWSNRFVQIVLLALIGLTGLFYGWRLFWFLTDDAFIAFRYVSNSMLGFGYVWNPPPFQPVEGYSSFLWVLLLDGVWRVFGIAPPEAANVVSLLFASLTVLTGIALAWRLLSLSRFRRHRFFFTLLLLVWILSNRTFLAWTSSGLETAMFNFLITLWIFCLTGFRPYSETWAIGISASSLLIYLTRPDGLLYLAVTAALFCSSYYWQWRNGHFKMRSLLAPVFLLVAIGHLVWRWQMYGAWLPNTYYAKSLSAIDSLQSGARYLMSFVIEYSLWFFFLLSLWLFVNRLYHFRKAGSRLIGYDVGVMQILLQPSAKYHSIPHEAPMVRMTWLLVAGAVLVGVGFAFGQIELSLIAMTALILAMVLFAVFDLSMVHTVAVLTIFLHVSYYTAIIGGDHFEYRVYSHLILFVGLGFLWMLEQSAFRVRYALLLFVGFIVLSWPIPWMHWSATHDLNTREETYFLKASMGDYADQILPATPATLQSYLGYYDRLQFWLIDRLIGNRHQEHKVFPEYLINTLPDRSVGSEIGQGDHPIMIASAVGVVSWVLPNVSIIDVVGLNDRVAARNPDLRPTNWIAHQRMPLTGYLDCLTPNVLWEARTISEIPDAEELSASQIRQCELEYSRAVEERLIDYAQANDWLRRNTLKTETIATTTVIGGRELAGRNILFGETRLKNWLHTIVFKVSGRLPDYAVISPYPFWDTVSNLWWFRENYELAERFGALSVFRRKPVDKLFQEFPIHTDYAGGLTLESATVEEVNLGSLPEMDLWLRFSVSQPQPADYQLTVYLVDTHSDARTEPQSEWPFGGYLLFQSSVWLPDTEISVPIRFAVPENLVVGSYRLGLFIYDPGAGQGLDQAGAPDQGYSEVQFGYFRVGDPPPLSVADDMVEYSVQTRWQDGIELESVGVLDHPMSAGAMLPIHLRWRSYAQTARDLTVFLHIQNDAGEIVAQVDQRPYQGRFPTSVWRAGEELDERIQVALPQDLAAGNYSVRLGLYDDAGRLALDAEDGDSFVLENLIQVVESP